MYSSFATTWSHRPVQWPGRSQGYFKWYAAIIRSIPVQFFELAHSAATGTPIQKFQLEFLFHHLSVVLFSNCLFYLRIHTVAFHKPRCTDHRTSAIEMWCTHWQNKVLGTAVPYIERSLSICHGCSVYDMVFLYTKRPERRIRILLRPHPHVLVLVATKLQ